MHVWVATPLLAAISFLASATCILLCPIVHSLCIFQSRPGERIHRSLGPEWSDRSIMRPSPWSSRAGPAIQMSCSRAYADVLHLLFLHAWPPTGPFLPTTTCRMVFCLRTGCKLTGRGVKGLQPPQALLRGVIVTIFESVIHNVRDASSSRQHRQPSEGLHMKHSLRRWSASQILGAPALHTVSWPVDLDP